MVTRDRIVMYLQAAAAIAALLPWIIFLLGFAYSLVMGGSPIQQPDFPGRFTP